MFSQLCRARPRTLWSKFGLSQPAGEVNEVQRSSDREVNGEDRCQLEHCTFCDYRVCCQVSPATDCNWETESLPCTDTDAQVTENPAYGLSSKNWLEAKDAKEDGDTAEVVKMEPLENLENPNCDKLDDSSTLNTPQGITPSQQDQDCDANTIPKMNQINIPPLFQQNRPELKTKFQEETNENARDISCSDQKHGKLTWSVLKHRQLSGDVIKNCDKSGNVIDSSTSDKNIQADNQDPTFLLKAKKNAKERSFPLSLMRPIAKINDKKPDTLPQQHLNHNYKSDISRQRTAQRQTREKNHYPISNKIPDSTKRSTNHVVDLNNPLSEIAQIKTEESIQEWLARIGESANGVWQEELEEKETKEEPVKQSAWCLVNSTDEEKDNHTKKEFQNLRTNPNDMLFNRNAIHMTDIPETQEFNYGDFTPKRDGLDTASVLCNASKASPANVPMVVMQCSRLHSHVGCKPPFQQTSLPMGTLVTALYQESDWLYVQTPHGVEGFVSSSNCVAIGTVNEPAHASRRPWEPCDFPIQVSSRKTHEFGRQQESYISAKLPVSNGKQAAPYVSTVKMKTNFYSDRYLSHTFKSKDSIKTAKTVTDILRSSPETKVSNQ